MDRKTILAFVLIALVLILTPSYMELVSPAFRAEQGPAPGNTRPQKPARVIESDELPTAQNEAFSRVSTFESSSKQIIVENNFYTATLDNKNGGSFSSFELTRYSRDDTSSVNLIDLSLIHI